MAIRKRIIYALFYVFKFHSIVLIWLYYPYLKWQWIFYRIWLYIYVTRWVSYKKQELVTLRERLGSPHYTFSVTFGVVHVAYIFSFLFCGFCLLSFVLCLVKLMLPVSMNYPFVIASSVFSNVYALWLIVPCMTIHFLLPLVYLSVHV